MSATESETGVQTSVEREIAECEAALSELRGKLQAALSQAERRKDETAKAVGEFDRCRAAYQDECRKLAGGQKAAAGAAKNALDEADQRLEGLRLLLADEEAAASALQEESLPVETRLNELCHLRKIEIDRPEIEALGCSLQKALENFRSQIKEADSKLLNGQWAGQENINRVNMLRGRLHTLERDLCYVRLW